MQTWSILPWSSNESAILLNKASSLIELDLHALFHDLTDRDQILCYGRNMQIFFDVGLFAILLKWDIANMLNGVNCVILNFHIVGSVELT